MYSIDIYYLYFLMYKFNIGDQNKFNDKFILLVSDGQRYNFRYRRRSNIVYIISQYQYRIKILSN